MLKSYAGASRNDGQGRPKLDIAIESLLAELSNKEKQIEELKNIDKDLEHAIKMCEVIVECPCGVSDNEVKAIKTILLKIKGEKI